MTKIAYGQCWSCPAWFWYGVLTVPSIPVDRHGRAIDDDGGTHVYRLAPICPECVIKVNKDRAANGLPFIDADTAKLPNEHLGAADVATVTMPAAPLWFVPTNGLPYHLQEEDYPVPVPLPSNIRLNPVAGLPDVIARIPVRTAPAPLTGKKCEISGCPGGGHLTVEHELELLLLARDQQPDRVDTSDHNPFIPRDSNGRPAHTMVDGTHAPYCWCRPGDARYAGETL